MSEVGWQPIATAPPYGEVLVYVVRAGLPGIIVAHQMAAGHSIEDHPPIEGGWYYFAGWGFNRLDAQPTHWMPLPARPGA